MNYFIYGGTYCDTELAKETVLLWARLTRHLNPHTMIVLFDTASPVNLRELIPRELDIIIRRWDDNPGHLARGGGDGAGRTHMAGIELAQINGFDYAVHWETDLIFCKPIAEVVRRVHKAGVKVTALPLNQFQFPEWGFGTFNVQWTKEVKFIERYAWDSIKPPLPVAATAADLKKILPEWRLKKIAGRDLFLLPYWGIRSDRQLFNFMNIHEFCPYEPPTWLHMTSDIRMFLRVLDLNQIELP